MRRSSSFLYRVFAPSSIIDRMHEKSKRRFKGFKWLYKLFNDKKNFRSYSLSTVLRFDLKYEFGFFESIWKKAPLEAPTTNMDLSNNLLLSDSKFLLSDFSQVISSTPFPNNGSLKMVKSFGFGGSLRDSFCGFFQNQWALNFSCFCFLFWYCCGGIRTPF